MFATSDMESLSSRLKKSVNRRRWQTLPKTSITVFIIFKQPLLKQNGTNSNSSCCHIFLFHLSMLQYNDDSYNLKAQRKAGF